MYFIQSQDMPIARIVLEVTLEGSAKKLITVRSALQICNKLDHIVEVKLNNAQFQKSSKLSTIVILIIEEIKVVRMFTD